MNILFIGDIFGQSGRKIAQLLVKPLREVYQVDLTIANVENAAGGLGITPDIAKELFESGVDVMTSGNHIWKHKEIFPLLEGDSKILRPGNYPAGNPGHGDVLIPLPDGRKVVIINLIGRTYMENVDSPFTVGMDLVEKHRPETSIIIVDFHAEATSEKQAMGRHFDGLVSMLVGTHTHVQTADEQILPGGTAYITDAGMTGPRDSIIGMEVEAAIDRFLLGRPAAFKVAKKGPAMLCGVIVSIEPESGKAISIERIQRFETI
jgi:hypothetical protein